MLKNLLKKYLNDDAKVDEFLNDMKSNKIYLSNEENIDRRYSKLQNDYTTKEQELKDALEKIGTFEQSNANVVKIQQQLADAQGEIAKLQGVNKQLTQENALKVALLSNKAKSEDIDYLLFKLSKDENAIKYDDDGNITNVNEVLDGLKKNYPSHFENGSSKKVDVNELPNEDGKGKGITKEEFLKKPYGERVKFAQENPEAFEELSKE